MNTDTSIIVYKFRPERTGFHMYTHRVYTTAIDFPCITPLEISKVYDIGLHRYIWIINLQFQQSLNSLYMVV